MRKFTKEHNEIGWLFPSVLPEDNPEEDFKPIEGVNGFLYFKDGDRLDIPFEILKQKPEIHIVDEPCGVSVSYKRPENETEVYSRLLSKILHNARQKFIKRLDLV